MKGYWDLGLRLMRSRAYRVSAFNYVHHNWHRNMKLSQVISILEEVKELCSVKLGRDWGDSKTMYVSGGAVEVKFKRTYIPKVGSEVSEGNARPLGVPSLS